MSSPNKAAFDLDLLTSVPPPRKKRAKFEKFERLKKFEKFEKFESFEKFENLKVGIIISKVRKNEKV